MGNRPAWNKGISKAAREAFMFALLSKLNKEERVFVMRLCGRKTALWESTEDRFWKRVHITTGCWEWIGALDAYGYGYLNMQRIGVAGSGEWHRPKAHRVAYAWIKGSIPGDLDLDHLCRNRKCVCPAHLEPVTRGENLLRSPLTLSGANSRKTHCLEGHPLEGYNAVLSKDKKHRHCRICHNKGQLDRYHRNRESILKRRKELKNGG